jgi:XisI protein
MDKLIFYRQVIKEILKKHVNVSLVNAPDIPIAQYLLDAGIPKDDIVLAFQAPYRRELSGFAVA